MDSFGFPVAPETLLLFCLTELAFSLSPGVIVMLVAARAINGGMRPAMAAAFGGLFGNLLFFAASATAVGALLLSLREWFFIAQWFGAGYLFVMATMLFFGTARQVVQPPVKVGNAFWQGLALQLANPKTILFFIAFLPLFVDADKPAGSQMIVLAAASFVVEFFVLFVYAKIATISAQLTAPRFRKHLHRTAALILITAAISLLLLQDN